MWIVETGSTSPFEGCGLTPPHCVYIHVSHLHRWVKARIKERELHGENP
jgi:hypothetical protein